MHSAGRQSFMACPEHVRKHGDRKERLGITEHPLLFKQFQRQTRCDRQCHTARDRSWTGPERRGTLSCQGPHLWQGFNVRGRARKDVEHSIYYLNISESLGAYPTRKIWKEHRIPSTETIWWLIWGSEGLVGEQWRVVMPEWVGMKKRTRNANSGLGPFKRTQSWVTAPLMSGPRQRDQPLDK